jgi:hypothetical protein
VAGDARTMAGATVPREGESWKALACDIRMGDGALLGKGASCWSLRRGTLSMLQQYIAGQEVPLSVIVDDMQEGYKRPPGARCRAPTVPSTLTLSHQSGHSRPHSKGFPSR